MRVFQTRTLAAKVVTGAFAGQFAKDRKIFNLCGCRRCFDLAQEKRICVIKVIALGTRRGPASEAQLLYEDLSPPQEYDASIPKFDGKGRPTKKTAARSNICGKVILESSAWIY